MVVAIASGEMTPVWKTLSPRRTTSRSSCSVLRRCCCTDAILRRTELEPISIAANVGIVLYLSRRLSSAKLLDAGEDSSSQVKIHRSEDSCAHAKFLTVAWAGSLRDLARARCWFGACGTAGGRPQPGSTYAVNASAFDDDYSLPRTRDHLSPRPTIAVRPRADVSLRSVGHPLLRLAVCAARAGRRGRDARKRSAADAALGRLGDPSRQQCALSREGAAALLDRRGQLPSLRGQRIRGAASTG